MIRLMPVGGPQDVGQEGVATGRGDFSLSSSDQGACAFCSVARNDGEVMKAILLR
ncbi:hypothetical protein [Neobacillus terrae]|uniref:hypothetical protein n=1 Tax=Neobacillus terrae TaxID=3034837 RepID=UPI00140B26E0|nr:hypothetical protein [Neobacillus terrae]NHM32943.1 hypothetical protein [Neobacillus terrae]